MKKTDSTFILKSLINNIPTAVFWKDADLVFRGCNKEFSQQFGFSDPEKIIGKTDFDFPFSEHLRKKYNKDDREVLAGIYKVNYEEKQTQPNGSQKTLLVSKVPYYDDNQKIIGILGIYTDISHLKEIEQNLLIAKEKAENANQVKTEFIRNMEHDIRTPFCGIWGLANLLHEEETDPLKKSYLDDISSSAKELMDFCNSILDASMTELGALPILEKKLNLLALIEKLIKIEAPAARLKNICLTYEVPTEIPKIIIGDEYRLNRILLNILSNAIKFTEEGHIQLKVILARKSERDLILQFIIKDTGIGIPLEKQNSVYEKFSRLNPSNKGVYRGLGLGLNMVKQFMEELEGEIDLESEPGIGSTFTCTLPFKLPLLSEEHP